MCIRDRLEAVINGATYTIIDQASITYDELALPENIQMGPNWSNNQMILAVYAPAQPVMQLIITTAGDSFDNSEAIVMNKATNYEDTWWIELTLEDGVYDYQDQCPDTPAGSTVDVNGCKIFELPINNYRVEVASATCIGTSDGVIDLSVEDASFDYTVTITGKDNLTITGTSKTGSVTGLAKGTYEVCFKVDGQVNYEQCFEVVVGEPPALTAFIDIDNDNKKTSITMSGSNIYNVTINGMKQSVNSNTFETELSTGLNIIRVDTDLECQGFVEKEVFISVSYTHLTLPTKA